MFLHSYPSGRSTHWPLFAQGLLTHHTRVSHVFPVYSSGQQQTKSLNVMLHSPPFRQGFLCTGNIISNNPTWHTAKMAHVNCVVTQHTLTIFQSGPRSGLQSMFFNNRLFACNNYIWWWVCSGVLYLIMIPLLRS